MSDTSLTLHNVRALEERWGVGAPSGPSGGSQIADFQAAMATAGLGPASACVLASWLGGAPADAGAFWTNWGRVTAEDACEKDHASVPRVDDALEELRAASPALAALVEVKAGRKQEKEYRVMVQNAEDDAIELGKKALDKGKQVIVGTAALTGEVLATALPWKIIIALIVVAIVVALGWLLQERLAGFAGRVAEALPSGG